MKWLFAFSVLGAAALAVTADEMSQVPDDPLFKPLIGKRVTLDALAWENLDRGWFGRVLLPSGHRVYVYPAMERVEGGVFRWAPKLPQGRLVRLVGLLRRRDDRSGSAKHPEGTSYLALELESFTVIDRIERAFPHDTAKPQGEDEEIVEMLPPSK